MRRRSENQGARSATEEHQYNECSGHDTNHGPETAYPSPTLTAMILLSIPLLDIVSASLQKSIIVSTVPHAALGVNYSCAQGNISPFSQYTTIRPNYQGY
jgi:hypothetical protein